MQIDILLFGPQAALANTDRVSIQFDSQDVTVGHVMVQLGEVEPALASSLKTSRLAVNHAYAAADDTVCSEDEVALIGMVSGG